MYVSDVILNPEYVTERQCSSDQQLQRWHQQYHVIVEECNMYGKLETRILLDGKVLLKTSELQRTVHRMYKLTKGSGYKQVRREAATEFASTTASSQMKHLKLCQKTRPVFDNRAPLIPIPASAVQERHQIDLVSMAKYPVKRCKKRIQICAEHS